MNKLKSRDGGAGGGQLAAPMESMNQAELESAATLAATLLHKNAVDLFATAEKNPDLAREWLSELMAAWRVHNAKSELLIEAIEDVRMALQHAQPAKDNVVSLETLRVARAAR